MIIMIMGDKDFPDLCKWYLRQVKLLRNTIAGIYKVGLAVYLERVGRLGPGRIRLWSTLGSESDNSCRKGGFFSMNTEARQ